MNRHSLIKAFGKMSFFLALMIALPVVLSFTGEYPKPALDRYLNKDNVYWKIEQINISPIFDEPETTIIELYFQKPDKLYLVTDLNLVLTSADTIWTYSPENRQIQKTIGGGVFNPFDFIDTTQAHYQVVESDANSVSLKCVDDSLEPDSLRVIYTGEGAIKSISYMDINENEIRLLFIDESFERLIPKDNFLTNTPEGVELIDLSDD